ncbi:AMP-binding protein [Prescottella defluvii]|uniref:AMP-binding protein n=1 Tax=Prescottella defluvii TaxID=1323361 RepID=UPI0004F2F7CA|nr:AMP-binding protein [Prescottella defluvii]
MHNHYRSIGRMLQHWSQQRPDFPGIAVEGVDERTFADWYRRSSRLATGLAALAPAGLRGRGIGFAGKNAVTWGEVLAAASLTRAFAVPLNWRLSHREMQDIVADAGLDAIVVEAEFMPLLGHPVPEDGRTRLLVPGSPPQDFEEWLAPWSSDPIAAQPDPEDIAIVIYTSGTSGRPKGVQLSNRAIAANLASEPPWRIDPGDVVMVPAPNFHISGTGWIFYCLGLGAGSHHVLDVRPELVLRVFAGGRVNHALTVPAVVQMLVQHEDARTLTYPNLVTLIYGGSPMSPAVAARAQEIFDCDLMQAYGMSETCGPITVLDAGDHRRGGERLASAGRPVPGVEMGVFDPVTGERAPARTTGEVWTRSEMLLTGYRNQPDELAAVLRPDGWFRTGDAGYVDEDGYLFLCDRVKDMIVSGGENVYPVEVENVLMSHPGVRDAAVIGVPHERWGETVKAVVVQAGDDLDTDHLIDYCREHLAHYKCPTSVDVVPELPRNPSGKLLKRELRGPYWAGRERGIA